MVSLADVRKCAQDLETKSSSQKDKSVVTAAEQMRSNLTLLELSSPSSKSLEKLCLLYRKPLVPLYKLFTAHTCRFASTLFVFIHEEKVSKCEEKSDILAWEKVLRSILSGVVDYLEDESVVTGKTTEDIMNQFVNTFSQLLVKPQSQIASMRLCAVYTSQSRHRRPKPTLTYPI
ncbi:hypothetical protein PM082_012844 [Marasmius tenuissimus]|nr:hypothetical protein PM082_012844 [Marasmius tenuissimus]